MRTINGNKDGEELVSMEVSLKTLQDSVASQKLAYNQVVSELNIEKELISQNEKAMKSITKRKEVFLQYPTSIIACLPLIRSVPYDLIPENSLRQGLIPLYFQNTPPPPTPPPDRKSENSLFGLKIFFCRPSGGEKLYFMIDLD